MTEQIRELSLHGACYLDSLTPEEVHVELLKMIAKMPKDPEPTEDEKNVTA
jgi:hypothetical protein